MSDPRQFFGKFRATVQNNEDPDGLGRLRLRVPGVLDAQDSNWALPCLPFAGPGMGSLVLPPVGANVWVEFEHGDIDYPIWTGGWWSRPEDLPAGEVNADPTLQNILLRTAGGQLVALNDSPSEDGGIQLRSRGGAQLTVSDAAITLTVGGQTLTVTATQVEINPGTVTPR